MASNNSAGRNNDRKVERRPATALGRRRRTRATLGLSFATHELGANRVKRDGGDFYDRASNLNEQTEIDQNQQSLTIHHDLLRYPDINYQQE